MTKKKKQNQTQQISTLADLQGACREKVNVRLQVTAGRVRLAAVYLLTPEQSEEIERLLAEVHPPVKEVEGKPILDFENPDYQKQLSIRLRQVRNYGLYRYGCEWLRAAAPGLSGLAEISDWVQRESKLTEGVLDQLWQVVHSDGLQGESLESVVNFF